MSLVRVMDEQQDLVVRLENLYQNFKKEAVPRRTADRLAWYERERSAIWQSIETNDATLRSAGHPGGYDEKFKEAEKTNEKFVERMKSWGFTDSIKISPPATSKPLITIAENTTSISTSAPGTQTISTTAPGTQYSPFTGPAITSAPIFPLHPPTSNVTTTSSMVSTPTVVTTNSSPTTFHNNLESIQPPTSNGSDPSWSQQVEAQETSVTQLLKMLAENQIKLTASQISHRAIETRKIDIAPFDGNVKNYRMFRDMFGRAVNSGNWSNIDLFMYLQSKLTGDAYNAVSSLEVTDETYFLAWEILDRRFNNRRKLVEAALRPIINNELHVEHNNCASGKAFMSAYQGVISNLKQYNVTIQEVIMEIVLPKLNVTTRARFEDHIGRDSEAKIPTFDQLDYFFEKELRIWEASAPRGTSQSVNQFKSSKSAKSNVYVTNQKTGPPQPPQPPQALGESHRNIKCFICEKNHVVIECEQFLASNDRGKLLRNYKICIFCTKHRYMGQQCNSWRNLTCDICQKHHITLMHPLPPTGPESEASTTMVHVTQDQQNKPSTVLPTAVVSLLDRSGSVYPVRCLVDLCAERSYVCESIVQTLRLKKHKTRVIISGINGITGHCNAFVKLILKLNDNPTQNVEVEALVVPKITGMLPASPLIQGFNHEGLQLADSPMYEPSFVGALLGGDIAPKLFLPGVPNKITADGYLLQPTHMGWIVSGASLSPRNHVSTFVTFNESAEKLMKDNELTQRILAFYELPEPEVKKEDCDEYCEQLFNEKHFRLPDGRYVVPIPWKKDGQNLGHSYRKAVKMFLGQENKWRKNQEHYEMSNTFMQEYASLNHMTRITENVKSDQPNVYYIPYLSIFRKDALTTKLRNVFNASMPSSNGLSLNDMMWDGPKLQTNIRDVLITARSFKYIYSADISKMFRQILILPEDREKLRIIWRSSPDKPIDEYMLNTVTYGTDAAPYQAIRTVHQAGIDNASVEIADIIKKAFYVDDLLYGADTMTEATRQLEEIKNALSAGKLPLTKWMSNCKTVLSSIPVTDQITAYINNDSNETKVLGVRYNFATDQFQLNLKRPDKVTFTKRGISSASASFYDPLGFILPFIMMLRIFLQRIWRLKVEWDEIIDEKLQHQFENFLSGIHKLNNIGIPRHIPCDSTNRVELIGFSDASNSAQAAVIYDRIATEHGYTVTLLTSKGNVTKLKNTEVLDSHQCTIPKMELEALLTLCTLYQAIRQTLSHRIIKFTAYTDSMVVLGWIRSNKSISNKFVERRVTKIKNIISPSDLHYVKSEENPADPASRGLTAEQLSSCSLWFLGPSWLQSQELPTTPYHSEVKVLITQDVPEDMFERFSDWEKVLRITAMCLRWILRRKGEVTADEVIEAKARVIRYYQTLHLSDAINCLKKGKQVPKKHWLYRLSPFLDLDDTLRVGGRLANASGISESQRHPIVIPKCHGLTLLLNFIHLNNGHANNSLMLRIIIEDFWIPGIRNLIKSSIRRCTTCIRWNARPIQPHMSHLPKNRVSASSTFDKVGVDLCGPFSIKASPLRFDRTIKVWVVNFVCFSTKAAHLELVTSLSSEHFIAAFIRFCSRRGVSSEVWSDNGTNLVGANRILREVWQKAVQDCEQHTVIQEVKWRFIPRHSPTFGGLWEACVKSLKYFTKRMADVKNLTYEEFTTLLCRIEALLNSRPLYPNPLTPDQDPALTPFHFLTQRGYKALSIDSSPRIPLTQKWLIMHQIQREFWLRFKTEYLRELQSKKKWVAPQPNLAIDDVVLVKEPSITPGDWKMGRVTRTFPDPHGVVRKVGIVTATKEEKIHAVNQLVPLLTEAEDNQAEPNEQTEVDSPAIEIPTSRRSKRLAPKISLVHLCLLTLLTWIPNIPAHQIEELSPGIHLKKIGDAYIKSFDLDFSVKTSTNITHDIEVIRKTANEFHQECLSLSKTFKKAADQCSILNSNIANVAQHTIAEMKEGYQSKAKRWISLTAKGLGKAAPAIAASLGFVYQEAEIWSLRKQIADTKSKVALTANALLNITEIEYETIEGKLNEVIAKQQEVLMEETVLNYAENIELLFTNILLKHETITDIQPYPELRTYVDALLSKLPTVQLPDIGNDIFRVYPVTKTIQEGVVIVSFTIPLISKHKTSAWVIIIAPDWEGDSIILSNNARVQTVIVSENNKTFADVTMKETVHNNIFDNIKLKRMDNCTTSIFSKTDATTTCSKSKSINEEITELYDDLVVIINNGKVPCTIQCDNSSYRLTLPAAIVNTTECAIITGEKAITGHKVIFVETKEMDGEARIPGPNSSVTPLVHDPKAQQLRLTLQEQFERWSSPDTAKIVIEVLAFLCLITIASIAVKCCLQRQTKSEELPASVRWFPEYIGPMKTSSSVVP